MTEDFPVECPDAQGFAHTKDGRVWSRWQVVNGDRKLTSQYLPLSDRAAKRFLKERTREATV